MRSSKAKPPGEDIDGDSRAPAVRPDFIQQKTDGVRWLLAPSFAPLIEEILKAHGTIIKASAAKVVERREAGGKSFYLKTYRHAAYAFRPAKFFFKPSQAKQEWDIAQLVELRRIPVVRHVALGERWAARGLLESILITESFPGVPLDEAKSFDVREVVAFVDRLAMSGLLHTDMHPANLLLNRESAEIRLVDLHGMKVVPAERADESRDAMLAQLCIHLDLPVSPAVRARGHTVRKQALAARARRCLKRNRDFDVRRFGAFRWNVRLDAISPALESALGNPDAFLQRARVLKAGRSSTVGAAAGLVIKRFNFRRLSRPLKDLFRLSRSEAAFLKAYHLELCGIRTARALAAADERRCGLVWRGFAVNEELRDSVVLSQWSGDAVNTAQEVAALVARLHEEGFSHRDLKETNILVDPLGHPALVDLEGICFDFHVPHATAAANLRRLAEGITACGKLTNQVTRAFILTYCRHRKIRPRDLFA